MKMEKIMILETGEIKELEYAVNGINELTDLLGNNGVEDKRDEYGSRLYWVVDKKIDFEWWKDLISQYKKIDKLIDEAMDNKNWRFFDDSGLSPKCGEYQYSEFYKENLCYIDMDHNADLIVEFLENWLKENQPVM